MKLANKSVPIFSVITVCLNNLDGLKCTHESLKQQICLDYEWIVVDGGSGDGTVAYLQSLSKEECQWVSEKDNGLYDAMNKGIGMAQGDYLLFLNSGDELASDTVLAEVAEAAKENDHPDLIYGDALERRPDGEVVCKPAYSWRRVWYGMFTHHQAIFYRRQVVGDQRYRLKYRIASDYAFTCEFLGGKGQVLYLQQPICLFEGGGITSSGSVHIEGMREQWAIGREILGRPLLQRLGVLGAHLGKHAAMRIAPALYKRIRYKRS